MSSIDVITPMKQEAVLKALGIDASSASGAAALLVCQRYGLDPLLKHLVLIGQKPYITRDGYLHIAHRSGVLDGIEVIDRGVDDTHYWATVSVHRKDMSRPFTYVGRYPKNGQQKQYGPEMSVKTAEVAALRRAFDVSGFAAVDEAWDDPEVDSRLEPERPHISGLNVKAFIDKCAEVGCTNVDVDNIVSRATQGRTLEPIEVFADEVPALRAAFEGWQAEQSKVVGEAVAGRNASVVSPTSAGKKVAKGVGPTTSGVEDVKPQGELV